MSFAAPYPGKIIPVDLDSVGGRLVCQKDAFLCAAKGTKVGRALDNVLSFSLRGKDLSAARGMGVETETLPDLAFGSATPP